MKGKCLLLNYQMALPGNIWGKKRDWVPCILKMSNKLQPCSATKIFLLGWHTDSEESKENLLHWSNLWASLVQPMGFTWGSTNSLFNSPVQWDIDDFIPNCVMPMNVINILQKNTSMHVKIIIISKYKPPFPGCLQAYVLFTWQQCYFSYSSFLSVFSNN